MLRIDDRKSFYDIKFSSNDYTEIKLIGREFDSCTFANCNFTKSSFDRCKFVDCDFNDCNLSLINVLGSRFNNINFYDCKIIGVNWTEANWSKFVPASPIKFFRCLINLSSFYGLNLQEIEITDSISKGVDYRDADLTGAYVNNTDFEDSLFVNTNVMKADFRDSIDYNINLFNNKIKGAKFSLPDALNLLSSLEISIT